MPRVPTFKRDLTAAGIPFEDERGRRVDLHALLTTFGTLLSASAVSRRVAMELMRQSDLKLTMKVYTDASQLPLIAEAGRLPSFTLPWNDSQERTLGSTLAAGVSGAEESSAVAGSRPENTAEVSENVVFRHEKKPLKSPPAVFLKWSGRRDLAEIIAAWTKLPPEIRTAVLTLIRVSKLDAT